MSPLHSLFVSRRAGIRVGFLATLTFGVASSAEPDSRNRGETDATDPVVSSETRSRSNLRPLMSKKVVLRMSLQDAIRTAVDNALGVEAEKINRQNRRRDLIIERAVFDPYFNLGFTYAKNRDPTVSPIELSSATPLTGVTVNPFRTTNLTAGVRANTVVGSTVELGLILDEYDNPAATLNAINPQWRTGVEARITQPLLKNAWYDVNSAGIRIAENSVEIADERHDRVVTETVFKVANAFWNVVFAHRNYEARTKALEVARQQLEMDHERVSVGRLAEVDVATSERQMARRKTQFDEAWALFEQTRDDVLFEMNYAGIRSLREIWREDAEAKPFDSILFIPTTEPNVTRTLPVRDASIEAAFRNRPEFREVEFEISNQRLAVDVARNQLLPRLDLTASWRQSGLAEAVDDSFDSVGDGDYYNWAIGIEFEIPLSLRGPKSDYENAQGVLRQVELKKQNLENVIVMEVDRAIRDLEFAYRAAQNLRDEVRAQEKVLEAERERREAGKTISYTVAEIENDLIDIQAQDIRARTDFEKARVRYEKAVGTLLESTGYGVRGRAGRSGPPREEY